MDDRGEKAVESQRAARDAEGQRPPSSHEKDGVELNSNPNPQLFVVQDDGQPPSEEKSDAESGRAVTLMGDEMYPEGGLEAWLVVFGSWCGLTASLGLMNTIAIFQTYVSTHQLLGYSEGSVGWIFSVYTALCFFCGIYIGPLFDKYGPRWLIGSGSVIVVAGVMIMSICTQYWHFMLCFGILNGVGSSLLFTPSITAVGHYFRKRRGLASGLASTGGGVGGVIFPLMLQTLFERVGWAWAIRSLGFLCLFLLIFANLLIKKRLPPAKNASAHPDFKIFKEKAFLLLTIGVFMLEFGLFIPLAYISSYALASGFDETFAFQILPILNAASVLGRALPGWWADRIGPFNTNMLSIGVTIFACYVVWLPFGRTMPGLVVFAVLFGFATGNNISITPVCVGRLCHTQHYGRYYATCYTVVSVACLIGIPVGGSIVAAAGGDYWALIVFTGLTQVLSVAAIYAAKGVSVGWKPWTNF
ncbi:Uu.00g108420.m01.CDS01 [Anthostomella pinea]|uniref:Uu.00g108420.m01.CDS01 n=1 Tax=Anthostomella pinea TaxID=933095 RepID=A0AAI8YFZ8_9PEZI|nr:Uu.00g108420.m01.CDS01 [Anthostomella pinea]